MTQHQRVRLADVSTLITKGTTPKTLGSAYSNQGIPFLRSEDVVGSSVNWQATKYFIDQTTHELLRRSILRGGDVLVTIAGTIGRVGYVPLGAPEMNCNQAVALIRLKSDLIDYRYAKYALQSPLIADRLFQQRTTATIPNISLAQLGDAEIPLPPLDEQQRIVDVLDRAASIQRLRQAADEKLKQIIPALFVDMFGGTAQIKDRWPQMRLDEVADIGSGITKGRQIDPAEAIDVPYLRVANVQDGYLDMDEIKTITIRRTEQAKYALQNGDIVMTEGGDLDKLGRGYVWANELPYCAHQNHVFKVRPRQQLVSPYFLATYVGSPAGKDYFLRVAKRTTGIASINKTQLSALPVPMPPIELQQAFEQKLSDLRSIQRLGNKATAAALQAANAASAAFFAA